MTAVHLVVPAGVDDPARPSGGNTYDRRLAGGLGALGWQVDQHLVLGSWPQARAVDRAAFGGVLAGLADGSTVVVDGLVGCAVPELLVPEADRLRLVVIVHMPLGHPLAGPSATSAQELETAVLSAVAAVVTTSRWSRRWLIEHYSLRPERLHVAEPGVDAASLAPGTPSGGRLLCVGAVTSLKGHDVLLSALADLRERRWSCDCVGSLDIDPGFVAGLGHTVGQTGMGGRVRFHGPLSGRDLDAAYADADVLVLASRGETYGMVVSEALAHGLPVIATSAGGIPEAVGVARDGSRPGVLVPSGDAGALAGALADWLDDASGRARLRRAASERRATLRRWAETSTRVAHVLEEVGT